MKTLGLTFFPTQFSGEAAQYELGMHRLPQMIGDAWVPEWIQLPGTDAAANARRIADARPDFVLLHAHRFQVPDALALANALGELCPEVPLLQCGWTAHPPYVDAVIAATQPLESPVFGLACGEVEAVLPAVLERVASGAAFLDLEGLPGLALRDTREQGWRGASRYEYVHDLDALPDVSLEHIPKAWQESKAGWLELARGCRFRCSFCYGSAFEHPELRRFGPERISAGVRRAAEQGVSVLGLLSSSNSFDVELLRSLVGAFRSQGIRNMAVAGPVHARYIRGEVLELLGSLDWRLMTIGLQTTNRDAQRLIRRGDDPEALAETVERIKAFITPEIEIVLGLPGDSPEGFKSTVRFLLSLPVNITVHTLRLDPWSSFLAERQKLRIAADFVHGARVLGHPSFPAEQMDECRTFLRELGAGPWSYRAGQLALDGEHLNAKQKRRAN
jgi:pyruvate-formate lyase-activating enzyme